MDAAVYKQNENLILDDMMILNKIYIDLEFLKYIQLGKIISHQNMSQVLYGDILKIVLDPTFITRHTNDVDYLFSKVHNVETLLRNDNSQTEDIIFSIAPSFSGAIEFVRSCLEKSNAAKRITHQQSIPLAITIDASVIPNISQNLLNKIADEYSETFDCEVRIIRHGLSSITNEQLSFDSYFVSDMSRFNNTMIDHLDKSKMMQKYLFCSKILPLSKMTNATEAIIPVTFAQIEFVMAAATKFYFIDPFPCLT